jgi:acetoin utilization deacetylase AcuC-like enzyme
LQYQFTSLTKLIPLLKIAYHPIYQLPLPEGHRFPMSKYELIPFQLIREGFIQSEHLFEPKPVTEQTILLTHTYTYWQRMKKLELNVSEMRKIGFPLTAELIERERIIAQGTIDCIQFAKQYGVSMNIAGGTHHAFSNKGEGFCLLNDFAMAANYALNHNLAKKILIIDLDVHQGNGTANIFSHEDRVFTLSMHGKHNYPFLKEQSNLDIELNDGITDEEYLSLMHQYIPISIKNEHPDLIFYLSGVDILATDKFGKLNITQDGCTERDRLICNWCKDQHIPLIISMGGGYSPKIADIVNAHCNTFKTVLKTFF